MTRYSKEEFGGGVVEDEKVVDMTVSITLQWMSGKIINLQYDPRLGWYHLKQKLSKVSYDVNRPTWFTFYRKKENGEYTNCEEESRSCNIKDSEHLYVLYCEPISTSP